jgi:hypothetical protein
VTTSACRSRWRIWVELGAGESERPAGQLQPERGRLGVDAVRPADRERASMLVGARDYCRERTIDSGQD